MVSRQCLLVLAIVACPLLARAADPGESPARFFLMTMPAAGGEAKLLAHLPDRHCGSPRWSPDGEQVAFDIVSLQGLHPHTDKAEVCVVDASGENLKTIGKGGMPSWSPDGKNLAWHTYSPGACVVADADGGNPESVADHWGNPVWLQDGQRLATRKSGGFGVYDLATGRLLFQMRCSPRPSWGYDFSPSGERMAYRSDDDKLVIAPLNPVGGDEVVRIRSGTVGYSSWSPDGKKLVFDWRPADGEPSRLYFVEADGESPPMLIKGQPPGRANIQPNWSRDGETLVFTHYGVPPETPTMEQLKGKFRFEPEPTN